MPGVSTHRTAPRQSQDRGEPCGTTAHLADLSSALKSATGPRCVSLSGLTIELMLCDLTAGDIERHHADQPLLCVEKERSRAAVDLDGAQRHARKAGDQAEPVDQRARDAVAPVQRPRERRHLAAAVAGQLARRARAAPRARRDRPARRPRRTVVPARRAARASSGSGAGAARRGVWRGWRAGARCPRSCRRSPRSPDSRSRTRRAAAAPLAARARGSPAAPASPATANRPSRRAGPDRRWPSVMIGSGSHSPT